MADTAGGDLGALLCADNGAIVTNIVTLKAGKTKLAVHRKVLVARSPKFKSMFIGNNSNLFLITDMEGPLLRRLVAYCYTLQASQLLSIDPQLREAAEGYGLAGLKDACEQYTIDTPLGAMLDASDDAIVTLEAGDTRLEAHRKVLEARSNTFKAKFSEKGQKNSKGEFPIKDMEVPMLGQLVAYCYTLQAPQLPDMAPKLLAAAHTFGLSGLKDACEQQVVRQLAVENAIEMGVLAMRCSCSKLEQAAVAFIKANIREVMMTQGWDDNRNQYPHDLLDLTRLILGAPAKTRTPATVEGTLRVVNTSHQLLGNHGRIAPTTAAASTALQDTSTSDATSVPHSWTAAAAEAGPAPFTHPLRQPHSRHTPAAAAASSAARHTPSSEEAAVSHLRNLSKWERDSKLIKASQQGAVKELWLLLAAGADVGARDKSGLTALHWAAFEGHPEVTRILVDGGADVGARSSGQDTPLHFAVLGTNVSVVRLLLASSADPNARNQYGRTPLHLAAWWGLREAVVALMQAGADAGTRDDDGKTPRDYTRLRNRRQLPVMLS